MSGRKRLGGITAATIAVAAGGVALYVYVIRPWHLRWQTTPAEASQPMPGDELVPDPSIALTRAVTIEVG